MHHRHESIQRRLLSPSPREQQFRRARRLMGHLGQHFTPASTPVIRTGSTRKGLDRLFFWPTRYRHAPLRGFATPLNREDRFARSGEVDAMACRFLTRCRFYSCSVALLLVHDGAVTLAAQLPATTSRVRSEHPVIAAAISTAAEHSTAFRTMVEAVERTNGIVYMREGTCRRGLRACLAGVYSAPSTRFVFVKVDLRLVAECELMASIGHELQHALEVLENPKIIDNYTLAHFYMHEGPTGDDIRFETEAAMRAGLLVEKELTSRSKCRS
jgi:hypothetical protein